MILEDLPDWGNQGFPVVAAPALVNPIQQGVKCPEIRDRI